MALQLRIRTAMLVIALAAAAAIAGLATATASVSHVSETAGGMGPHGGSFAIQPDPVVIIDR